MPLLKPKLIALDSSQIGNWCRERVSSNTNIRAVAREFEQAFAGEGHLLVVTLHHMQELLCHSDEIAEQRVDFLSVMPLLAWPRSYSSDVKMGGMLDIRAAEVEAAIQCETATDVRNEVIKRVFEIGPGAQAMEPFFNSSPVMEPFLLEEAASSRENIAITRAKAIKAPDWTIAELKTKAFASPEEISRRLVAMAKSLAAEIEDRGDRRIGNPNLVAGRFLAHVVQHAATLEGTVVEAMRRDFAARDVDIDELGQNAKFEDINELATFRRQLRVILERLPHISWEDVKAKALFEKLPAAMMERGLRLFGQDQPERKGSEINDRYLATLACYADVTYVDKRTQDDFRRVKSAYPVMNELIRATAKVTNWKTVIGQISRLEPA